MGKVTTLRSKRGTDTTGNASEVRVSDTEAINLLINILKELQIANMHLMHISDQYFTREDTNNA